MAKEKKEKIEDKKENKALTGAINEIKERFARGNYDNARNSCCKC